MISYQLVKTVKYFHRHRITHKDIKLANVLFKRNFFNNKSKEFQNVHIFLTDFGKASLDEDFNY